MNKVALLDEHLRMLRLPAILASYRRIADGDTGKIAFLQELTGIEIDKRHENGVRAWIAAAHFPVIKTNLERSHTTGATLTSMGLQPAAAGANPTMAMAALVAGRTGSTVQDETPDLALAAAQGDRIAQWMMGMPSLAKLDVITYRIIAVGLPLISVGIIMGAMWAKEAWGAYWQWDPKETSSLLVWIIYLAYMHLHTRSQWRGLRTSWISVIGFAAVMFCYLGVNIWISGLHSYRV